MHQFFAQLGSVVVHRLSNPLSVGLSSSPASAAGSQGTCGAHHDRIPRWLKRLEQRFHIPGFHLHRREALQTHRVASQLVERGRQHERALEMAEAAACFEQAVALEPGNAEYLGLLSKQVSDRSYEAGASRAAVREFNRRAIEIADRAISAGPGLPDGHLARCVSRGRLALVSDNRTLVALAQQAQDDARVALELAPDNDVAHHLFGRWHYEMARQNFVVRALVKVLFGTDLPPGTFQEALHSYQRAAALRPSRLIHRVELGRTYARLGQVEEAVRELRLAATLEVEDVNAKLELEDCVQMLSVLEKEGAGRRGGGV